MLANDTDRFEERTTATIAEAFDVMVEASGVVHRNATYLSQVTRSFYVRALRPLVYIIVGMIVVLGFQQISLVRRDAKVDELQNTVKTLDEDVKALKEASTGAKIAANNAQEASIEAKLASDSAKKSLDEAIVQSQRGGVSPDVLDSIKKINEIYLCIKQKNC